MKVLVMRFHDLNANRVNFVYDLYEVLNVDLKNFLNAFTQKNLDYC